VIIQKQSKTAISAKRIMASCCQCRACTDLCSRNLLGHPIEPHEIMRTITSGKVVKPQTVLNAAYCSGCGMCELYACPQSLHPREIILALKAELRKNKVQLPKIENFDPVHPNRDFRKIPKHRLTARLGLTKYNIPALLYEKDFEVKSVKVLFSQHAGAPAEPIVKQGDLVYEGQKIAQAKDDALSLCVHASISGKVIQVCDKYAVIKKMEVKS
ncbi:MAG: 4Fe-4S dicluster domain-containing protein, partial [Clostridia bacterium]|nr:4Fe-4S dicluster domain-containing protein [Clostridia bacterium]